MVLCPHSRRIQSYSGSQSFCLPSRKCVWSDENDAKPHSMPHPRRPPPPISSPVVVAAIDKIPNFRSLLDVAREPQGSRTEGGSIVIEPAGVRGLEPGRLSPFRPVLRLR